jgi:hypothetical protein
VLPACLRADVSDPIARDPDPHVMCEDRPSRQPVAKVFVSVIVHSAFISLFFARCLLALRALSMPSAQRYYLTDLLAESRGACVCACVCCVTPPRNKTSLPAVCRQSIESAIFLYIFYFPASLVFLPTKSSTSINNQHLDTSPSCVSSSLRLYQRFYLPPLH